MAPATLPILGSSYTLGENNLLIYFMRCSYKKKKNNNNKNKNKKGNLSLILKRFQTQD
jgi:hypothetical protein